MEGFAPATALGHNRMAQHGTDENLLVRFYPKAVIDHVESRDKGRPVYKDVAYVQINVPGDKLTEIHRRASDQDKERFGRQWEAFQRQSTRAEIGTPLEEWPALTTAQRYSLKAMSIMTVEALAGLSDANMQNVGMDGRALRDKARAWLQAAQDTAAAEKAAEELAARDREIRTLQAQIDELKAAVAKPAEAAPPEATAPAGATPVAESFDQAQARAAANRRR